MPKVQLLLHETSSKIQDNKGEAIDHGVTIAVERDTLKKPARRFMANQLTGNHDQSKKAEGIL